MPLLSVFLRRLFAIGVGSRGERRRGLPAAEDGEGKKGFWGTKRERRGRARDARRKAERLRKEEKIFLKMAKKRKNFAKHCGKHFTNGVFLCIMTPKKLCEGNA